MTSATEPGIHIATQEELSDWDRRAVEVSNGHVYQSRAWADYRGSQGWRPFHLVLEDGFPLLVISRRWPWIRGAGAYATRGPIPADDPDLTADRAAGAAEWLAEQGIDVLSVDGETAAVSGLRERLVAHGFRAIEELQPSRHRMDLDLDPASDEDALLASFAATTRNLIRQAERKGLRVVVFDSRSTDALKEPFRQASPEQVADPSPNLTTCYSMLAATAGRIGFQLAPQAAFLDWTTRSLRAGQTIYLLVETNEGEPVAGATFYRHGDRLTYALSGDRADKRREFPGAIRLLVWRGIQLAVREGRRTMDLGGVDVPGARRKPRKGEPAYGMLQFKESFGAHWVELAGAHERTMRSIRYVAGRLTGRLAGALGR